MIIAGIDPGKTGAMVLLFPDNSVIVNRVPLMKLRGKEVTAMALWEANWCAALAQDEPGKIVIERASTRPGQSAQSGLTTGTNYGFIQAIAYHSGAPVEFVTPAVWKGKMGLLKSDKNASREAARRLMPAITKDVARVMDDGVAEAALLAWYGRAYL